MLTSLLLLLASQPAQASDVLVEWIKGVAPPSASIALAQTLPEAPGAIPASVPITLSRYTTSTLAAHASKRLAEAQASCTPDTITTFVQDALQAPDPISAHFYGSAIHMESTFCLDHGSAAQALEHFQNPDYRTDALPLVVSFKKEGQRTCIGTRAVMGGALSPTAFCSQTTFHAGPEFHGVVGWLTENTGGSDHQSVFYRHYVIVFVDRPGGGVAGFRGVVTRSKDLNLIQRSVVQAGAGTLHGMMQEKLNAATTTR